MSELVLALEHPLVQFVKREFDSRQIQRNRLRASFEELYKLFARRTPAVRVAELYAVTKQAIREMYIKYFRQFFGPLRRDMEGRLPFELKERIEPVVDIRRLLPVDSDSDPVLTLLRELTTSNGKRLTRFERGSDNSPQRLAEIHGLLCRVQMQTKSCTTERMKDTPYATFSFSEQQNSQVEVQIAIWKGETTRIFIIPAKRLVKEFQRTGRSYVNIRVRLTSHKGRFVSLRSFDILKYENAWWYFGIT